MKLIVGRRLGKHDDDIKGQKEFEEVKKSTILPHPSIFSTFAK